MDLHTSFLFYFNLLALGLLADRDDFDLSIFFNVKAACRQVPEVRKQVLPVPGGSKISFAVDFPQR